MCICCIQSGGSYREKYSDSPVLYLSSVPCSLVSTSRKKFVKYCENSGENVVLRPESVGSAQNCGNITCDVTLFENLLETNKNGT